MGNELEYRINQIRNAGAPLAAIRGEIDDDGEVLGFVGDCPEIAIRELSWEDILSHFNHVEWINKRDSTMPKTGDNRGCFEFEFKIGDDYFDHLVSLFDKCGIYHETYFSLEKPMTTDDLEAHSIYDSRQDLTYLFLLPNRSLLKKV